MSKPVRKPEDASDFTWGTVTALSPLRVRLDGDTSALPFTPDSLVDPATMTVSDRVRLELSSNNRVIVLGRAGGFAAVPDASDTVKGVVELTTSVEAVIGTDTVRATTAAAVAAAYKLPRRALRRVFAATNAFTNQTTYAFLPQAADRTALTMTFPKLRSDTRLVLEVHGTVEQTSGAAQNLTIGIRIGSTDYDVAMQRVAGAANTRYRYGGVVEVTGLSAGSLTIEPRFKTGTTSAFNMFISDDSLSYVVGEFF